MTKTASVDGYIKIGDGDSSTAVVEVLALYSSTNISSASTVNGMFVTNTSAQNQIRGRDYEWRPGRQQQPDRDWLDRCQRKGLAGR